MCVRTGHRPGLAMSRHMEATSSKSAKSISTRWTSTVSSKVNLPHAIDLCGANLVTLPSQFDLAQARLGDVEAHGGHVVEVGGGVLDPVPPQDVGVQPFVLRKREIKLPWREAGPPNHHVDKVDSDQEVVNKELSLSLTPYRRRMSECSHSSCRNVQRFRGGLVFKAHRLLYHSTLDLRVIKRKRCLAPHLLYDSHTWKPRRRSRRGGYLTPYRRRMSECSHSS